MPDLGRKAVAEFIGTFTLVFFAVGAAVFEFDQVGAVGVAFAFGLILLALAYVIGPTSLAPLIGAALAALLSPIFDLPSDKNVAQAPGTDPTGARVLS